ncbi:ATP-binding cassette domain-containing protein [Lysinibacillus sphaericus]|uniref:ATP-binding cassette domain-containing protein n=1 Tax=Lysinibacillus sphaericus TaxID=1421 RepID=A0A544UII1_LYSSH|nr:ATP-binding cassette domain-containing protein [Lysinibacillus sp. SDF0037]TQR32831.1 ATP-binding cassette domain-containing protein [Lysinibacillus sp. SDF0037]
MSNIIEVKNLTRDFETKVGLLNSKKKFTKAINSLSFSVKKGEVFGILGPNGAGKTTTIKILTTLLAPSSGEVKVLGHSPFGEESFIRPRINFIYGGERNLYWRITARENLSYFADLYKIDNKIKKERIDKLLDLVGLSERADERVETFSKGMKQRLQIARGLINEPEILFLDEPTIGLDPVGARELRDIIKTLSRDGKTIILTTHYMQEADELCDRIAIINKGRCLALDTPENLKINLNKTPIIELAVNEVKQVEVDKIKSLNSVKEVILTELVDATKIEIHSLFPYKVISNIVDILGEQVITNMTIRLPTLEDVYLEYIR